jgi:hypothetical protein
LEFSGQECHQAQDRWLALLPLPLYLPKPEGDSVLQDISCLHWHLDKESGLLQTAMIFDMIRCGVVWLDNVGSV